MVAVSPHNLGKREVLQRKARKGRCAMKYGELNLGQVEAIVNRLGGMDGVKRFLTGLMVVVAAVLHINRKKPFDPVKFIGEGWKIAEQDERSLALTELDMSKVRLETTLKEGESSVKGEEKLNRLKAAGHVRLDAAIFQALWENQGLIPEEWKEVGAVYFDGTIILSPFGDRCVLYLSWRGGRWRWYYYWLVSAWHARFPSAVLASV